MNQSILIRLRRIVSQTEWLLEKIFGSYVGMRGYNDPQSGKREVEWWVRRWNPAYYVGWVRVKVLGSECGSVYFMSHTEYETWCNGSE